ncbi:RNA-binding domain-containing protein [Lysinibacillus parviboronicapiens]|uniref:RNA-binding domain-containing protein n=1 Tax=Lysinibacillus parviboronicapiens TaxID=436516 RepID=UPI000D372B9C|nr:RNA-binding domain-containing protein [Lysinibacillus parviboronicapiens]
MKSRIEQVIKDKIRSNILYIDYPLTNIKFAKYICGLANKEGGMIILGVYDDGINLHIKNYPFSVNEILIRQLLSHPLEFKVEDYLIENGKLRVLIVDKAENLIKVEGVAYMYSDNGNFEEITEKTIFMSYTHNETNIASLIEQKLGDRCGERIKISRDINRLKYKDSIKEYMETIKKHDFVISIISDKYLKSQACMYEILELMRDRDYYKKLLFTVISESDVDTYFGESEEQVKPTLYSAERFNYITYWQEKLEQLKTTEKKITNPAHKSELVSEIKEVELITINIGDFIEKLKDGIGVSISELVQKDFDQFYEIIMQ